MQKGGQFIRLFVAIWFMALIINPLVASEGSLEPARTSQPGLFLEEQLKQGLFDSKALVILDLDDTTITTPEGQWLGRSEMFYYLVSKELEQAPGKTRQQIVNEIDPLLNLVYARVPVQLTDPTLPGVFQQLQDKGIIVIGMTARGFPVADVTNAQLQATSVRFTDTGPAQMVSINENRQFRIEHGVVMVGQGNKKGEALVALLKEKILPVPKQVMLVDDHERHLNSVRDALTGYLPAVSYQPVLCTYLEGRKPFDANESEQQLLAFLYQWRNDDELSRFIRQDHFSQCFISNCRSSGPAAYPQCHSLQQHFNLQSVH